MGRQVWCRRGLHQKFSSKSAAGRQTLAAAGLVAGEPGGASIVLVPTSTVSTGPVSPLIGRSPRLRSRPAMAMSPTRRPGHSSSLWVPCRNARSARRTTPRSRALYTTGSTAHRQRNRPFPLRRQQCVTRPAKILSRPRGGPTQPPSSKRPALMNFS